ncbi:MAG: galK [Prosthecobacter sp.]|nr:galK [Prosthecobacter sp.]
MSAPLLSAYAPGRVELLGNHTDYNEGVVLAAAIDRGLTVRGTLRGDGMITLRSATFGQDVTSSITELQPLQGDGAWANYALGVARELLAKGVKLSGFDAEVSGDVPVGNGLSSSAAFEVATAFFLLKLHALEMPRLEIAKLCRRAENNFVGVPSGLLDQATSVFGQASQVVHLDCRSEAVRTVPFPATLALVLAVSGVKHSLVAGEYGARREQCQAAAEALGLRALRDVTSAQLDAAQLDPLLRRRAAHIVGENERVTRAVDLLAAGDGAGFGSLMNASHESSRLCFENSTAELDQLVEIARSLPGVLGSRLTGGGFGGGTVTLVEAGQAEAVARALAQRYTAQSGHPGQTFVCRIAGGAA